MTNTNKKVNIFLIVLSLLLVAGSVFAFSYKSKNNDLVVHADSTTTNFYGSSVYVPLTPYQQNAGTNFSAITWTNAPDSIIVGDIWTDGNNYYYSSDSTHYVIDFLTHTWSTYTWTGLTSFYGRYVWTNGTNTFYSNSTNQYILDISTHTWSAMTWTGLTSFDGRYVWTNGTNTFYSSSSTQKVLSGTSWNNVSWSGLTSFSGQNIWTDGVDYYYSSGTTQYYKSGNRAWSTITWTGLTSFSGSDIWSDGSNTFYSNSTNQYILDISTHAWSAYTWSGLTYIYGSSIWNNGLDIYYSIGYVLDKASVSITDNVYFDSVNFSFIDNGNGTFSLQHNSLFYIMSGSTQNYSISDKFVVYNPNATSYSQNDYLSNVLINASTGLSQDSYYIPFTYNNSSYYARLNISCDSLSSVDFVKVTFESTYYRANPNNVNYYVRNILTYTNSINESISFEFMYFSVGLTSLNYYGDSSQFLYQLFDNTVSNIDDYIYCFNYRTYYLNNDYLNSQQYQLGYSSGYQRGKNDGYTEGYSAGTGAVSESQYNAGYSAGYSAGVIGANNYSFLGLISAVIDAPIQAFTGLFNFELLGVNILGFITSLFTLAVIITIVKKVV